MLQSLLRNVWLEWLEQCYVQEELRLLRLPVGRGGIINSPRFCFSSCVESRRTAHGWYRCAWSELRLLNSISSGICRQNTQFTIYTTTSKQQEGCTFKDSHPKCFKTTNSTAMLSPGAVNAVMYMFWKWHIQRSIRIQFVIILILFDASDYRLLYGNCSISFSPRSEKITWQSRVHEDLRMLISWCLRYQFKGLKLAWILIL